MIYRSKQGKKLASDQAEDDGEVTDEDEGAETNRTRAGRVGQASRRLRICRDLSDLIALNRGSSIKLPSSRDKSKSLYLSFCKIYGGLQSIKCATLKIFIAH